MQNEEGLVRRAKERDQEAFGCLYETYFDKIYRYVAFKIGDKTEAEDLTQQVFVNAYKSIPSYDVRGIPFSAWLFRIAHNQVVDHLRRRSKQSPAVLNEAMVSSGDDPVQIAERRVDIQQVMEATKRLTEAQREVIQLRFAGELPIAEVARLMKKSEGAVKALQHSAILALRRILAVEEYDRVEEA